MVRLGTWPCKEAYLASNEPEAHHYYMRCQRCGSSDKHDEILVVPQPNAAAGNTSSSLAAYTQCNIVCQTLLASIRVDTD
jgi:hypothetical protein